MREFSLLGFVAFLGAEIVEIEHAKHDAAEKVGKIVEKNVKAAIGSYEYGWPQLAESTQDERSRLGFPPDEPLLRTGEQRDSYKHVVEGNIVTVGSTLDRALWSELGTVKEPPRPVLMPSVEKSKEEILHATGRTVVAKLTGSDG